MLGAIAGDVIGSVMRAPGPKRRGSRFVPDSTFTDDTVLTVAIAESLLRPRDYVDALHEYFAAYPAAGYGGTFFRWCARTLASLTTAGATVRPMRVSPVAYAHRQPGRRTGRGQTQRGGDAQS